MSLGPFVQLANVLSEAVVIVDDDGTILAANRQAETMLDRPHGALTGGQLSGLLGMDTGSVGQYVRACAQSGAPISSAVVMSRNGSRSTIRCEGSPLSIQPNGKLAVFLRFFTPSPAGSRCAEPPEKSTANAIESGRADAALNAQAEKFRVTLASIGDAVITTDIDGKVTFLNPVGESLTGWSEQEALGKPLETVFRIINEYSRKAVENPAAKVLREGTVVGLANHTLLIARDGTETPIDDCAAPVRDAQGTLTGVVLVFRDFTERRRAEHARSELAAIIESSGDAIVGKTLDGAIFAWNQGAERLYGYTADEIVGQSVAKLVPPDHRDELQDVLQRVLREEQIAPFETVRLRKDGSRVDVWIAVSPVRNEVGAMIGVSSIARDITERKRMERLVSAQTEVLEAIATGTPFPDSLDVIVRTIEAQSTETMCSILLLDESGSKLLLGAAPSLPAEYNQAIHGITIGPNVGSCGTAAAIGETVIVSDILASPLWNDFRDLAVRHRLRACWSTPIRSSRGQILGTFAIYHPEPHSPSSFHLQLIDMAAHLAAIAVERKQAADELRQTSERLARTEAFSLIMATHVGLNGRWLKVPPTFCDLLGYSEHELLAIRFQDVTHPEDLEVCSRETQRMLRGESKSFDLEKRYIRKDGSVVWAYLNCSIVLNSDNQPVLFLVYIRDITERKRLEDQLRQSDKMEAVGRLAGGVSHDFNNLLTVIRGFGELSLEGLSPGDPLAENLEDIMRAADRAAALTRQLLVFSRKQILTPRLLNLNSAVSDTTRMLNRVIGEDIQLVTLLSPQLGLTYADPDEIGRVVMNLAINARDAMPQGGQLVVQTHDVEVDEAYARSRPALQPGSYVVLVVSDTGHGMDEQTKLHLFEPFFTTKKAGAGTGMGLATVYGIVKQRDGHITVTSEPGQGATFSVYLPRAEETEEYCPSEASSDKPDRGSETVLLVEDERVLRRLGARVLRSKGYTVLEAGHGGEALLLCERQRGDIHLLVTDVVMPQMSGRELAERLAPLRPEMKFLFMSGYTDDAVLRHGVQAAEKAFLQKPFSTSELARKVREVLDSDGAEMMSRPSVQAIRPK